MKLTDTKTGTAVNLRTQSYTFELPRQKAATRKTLDDPTDARFRLTLQSSPMPVELTAFEGTPTEQGVQLTWTTGSEQNNAGFRLQRRAETNGWTTVGRKDGAGTTSQPQRYRLTDTDLPADADSLTYRLKQIDTDGSTSFSDPITVGRGDVSTVTLKAAYPNPASNQMTVTYAVPETADDARLVLYDVLGRALQRVPVGPGRNTHRLDVSNLSSGTYVLRLQATGTSETKQVTVVQ